MALCGEDENDGKARRAKWSERFWRLLSRWL